jgi:hypothetical protein
MAAKLRSIWNGTIGFAGVLVPVEQSLADAKAKART